MKLSDAVAFIKVAMMDTAQKASIRRLNVLGSTSPCKPGCAACCSRLIHISVAEALVMHDELVKSGKWQAVRDRAKEAFESALVAHALTWFKMNRSCPVLNPETRLCEAYAVRPSPCSTHFVVSDPGLCDPWNAGSGEYQPADASDLHEKFMQRLGESLSGRGILDLRLPMPVALLFAEKIQIQSNLSAADVISLISSELG